MTAAALLIQGGNAFAGLDEDLMLAVRNGDTNAVRMLLAQGADPNSVGGGGFTALMSASESGNVRIIQMLVDAGADVEAVDNHGMTAVSHAASSGRKYAVNTLLDHGATMAREDMDGLSPSELARGEGYDHLASEIDTRSEQSLNEIEDLRIDLLDESNDGDFEQAADIAEEIYRKTRGLYGDRDKRTIAALNDLALMSMRAGRYDEAGRYYDEAHRLTKDVYGDSSVEAAESANNLGVYHYSRSNREAASEYFSEAYKSSLKKLGREDERTREFSSNLGLANGDDDDGMPSLRDGDTMSFGEGREAALQLRGGGSNGGSGVFGDFGFDPEMFEMEWTGLHDGQLAFIFNVLIMLLIILAAYVVYRILDMLFGASDNRKAAVEFEAKINMGYAKLLDRVDRVGPAVKHYEKALAVLGDDVYARYRVARLYDMMGDVSRAKRHYRVLISLLPPEHGLRRDAADSIARIS